MLGGWRVRLLWLALQVGVLFSDLIQSMITVFAYTLTGSNRVPADAKHLAIAVVS
jgi:hypothetical protein